MSTRISLRGLHRVIWVDTLRRVHNVGFSLGTAQNSEETGEPVNRYNLTIVFTVRLQYIIDTLFDKTKMEV